MKRPGERALPRLRRGGSGALAAAFLVAVLAWTLSTASAQTAETDAPRTAAASPDSTRVDTLAARTSPDSTRADTLAARLAQGSTQATAVALLPNSTPTVSLATPSPGIVYVRYGTPGAVHLHRGNLSAWRALVRAALDSLSASPGTDSSAELSSRQKEATSLLSVLRDFGSDRQTPEPASARASRPGAVREPATPTSPPTRPVVVIETPREEEDGGPGTGAALQEPGGAFAGPAIARDTTAVSTNAVPVPVPRELQASVPRTAASPETLRIELKERRVVQTQAILFETARAEILPGAEPMLEELAAILREEPEIRLQVEGHTDVRGSEAYNQALSERRAGAIRDWLVGKGIEPDRIVAIGLGEKEPFDPRTTLEAYALNRRVVFRILPEAPR